MLSAVVIAIATAVAAVGLSVILRRMIPAEHVAAADVLVEPVTNGLAGVYGVLVAFILAGAWDRVDNIRNTLSAELTALADLKFVASLMPPPIGVALAAEVDTYHDILRDQLAAPQRERRDRASGVVASEMVKTIIRFEPRTPGETRVQSLALDLVKQLDDQRRIRTTADQALPAIVWFILIAGSVSVLGVIAIASRTPLGWVYLACLAAIIGLALFSIYALSHPGRLGLLTKLS